MNSSSAQPGGQFAHALYICAGIRRTVMLTGDNAAAASAIASDLGIAPDQVNVKATTEEHLGFTGSGEGMACHAVCLIEKSANN